MDILEQANAIRVTPADIGYVADTVWKFVPASEVHRTALLMRALNSRFPGNPKKVGAAMARHMAVCYWIDTTSAAGFSFPKRADGSIPTDYAVFEAAAVHPLIQVGESLRFEPESFTRRVLALAQAVKT